MSSSSFPMFNSSLDARPLAPQSQSPLLSLPPELRNAIFNYVLAADTAFVDPAFVRAKSPTKAPFLGIFLTCRQMYDEADRRILLSQNRFRFTRESVAAAFFQQLPLSHRSLVHHVEVDARQLDERDPGPIEDWLRYMSWGSIKSKEAALHVDAPALKTLSLDFSSWTTIAMKRHTLWDTLRCMLDRVRGLDCLTIIGASRGAWMEKTDPWSPVHFAGTDSVSHSDLVSRMLPAVGIECMDNDHGKLITWTRNNGKIHLQVATVQSYARSFQSLPELCSHIDPEDPLPKSGRCTAIDYQMRVQAKKSTLPR